MRTAATRTLAPLLAATLALIFTAGAQAASPIEYPSFASTSGLQLNGFTRVSGSALELTPAEEQQSGTFFSDTEIQTAASFETEFEFHLHGSTTLGSYGPADGITFVLQPKSAEEVGESGGSLGYAGIAPSAAIEFDTYQDPEDPPVPYIGFLENGEPYKHLDESGTLPFGLYNETTPVWVWIEYSATAHVIKVYAEPGATKPVKPPKALLEQSVNLVELLGHGETFAGFTGGTGSGDSIQEILSWQLNGTAGQTVGQKTPPPPAGAHGSATQVVCNLIAATASDTCTATVADVDVPAAITPTGQVSFTSSSGGSFTAGNTCNLVATPGSPDTASCSVQYAPPSTKALGPAITANYGGDAHHSASSGKTFYPSAGELSGYVTIPPEGTASANGDNVEVPVQCGFPCSTSGQLISGPDTLGGETGTQASLSASTFVVSGKGAKKKHKTHKPVLLGSGTLTIAKAGGGKGTLVIKLNAKARRALAKAKGKPVKGVLVVTVRTLSGTLVKTERKTITIRPHPKSKKHGKSGKGH